MVRKLRIFISSPGDVGQERLIATRVIERLQGEFGGYVELEPILWEHEPLRATSHFQEQIVPPSETDIVVCILWSRLGTRLPDQFHRADGSAYASGTEWEFEDAMASFRTRGTPDLMVYRKTAEPRASMSDEAALMQRLQQKRALDAFIDHWFGNPQDTFRAAFHTFDAPDAFEAIVESHLRQLIQEKLPAKLTDESGETTAIQWYKGSPFRGLEAFDIEHAPIFFGRTRAVSRIKEAMTHQAASGSAFLLVFGMSGCGKSSLVRAGVIPTITQPGIIEGIGVWRWCVLRPTDTPDDLYSGLAFAFLEHSALPELHDIGYDVNELAALLRESPARAVAALQMGMKRVVETIARAEGRTELPNARIIMMVDQLEEIFTQPRITVEEREGFANALAVLAQSGLVWVIATMRSDFYPRCAEIPALSALKEDGGQFDVLPASFAEIGQMIRYPARSAGLRFETRLPSGEKLDETIHEEAAGDPEALPLLEFTLEQLFQARSEDNVLTFAAYERLGGIEGALARRAEEIFNALGPAAQATLPEVLRALVTIDNRRSELVAARRVPMSTLATTPDRKELLDAFIQARLLVTDRDDSGDAVVRVAHEALLRRWPRLQEWLSDDRDFLQTREHVAAAAVRWQEEGRRAEYLLPDGKPLADAVDLQNQRKQDLDDATNDFIDTSRRTVQSKRRRTMQVTLGIASAFCVVVLGFGIFSYSQWQQSEREKRLAMSAVNQLTYDVPRRLIDLPGSRPILRGIFADNLKLLSEVHDSRAISEKRINYQYMGDMWMLLGDTEKAQSAYTESLRLVEKEAKQTPGYETTLALSACWTRIGDVNRQIGDATGALNYYQKALNALQTLGTTQDSSAVKHDTSVALEKIGDSYMALNDLPQALASYQRSLEIVQGTSLDKPESQRDLAISYAKYGDACFATNDLAGATGAFQTSRKLLEKLNQKNASGGIRRDLLATYSRLGDVYLKSGNQRSAEDSYQNSLRLAQTLAHDPSDLRAQQDLSSCYTSLIGLFLAKGDPGAALDACGKSIRILEPLAKNSSDRPSRQNLKYLYERLRDILYMRGDMKAGAEAQEKSLLLAIEMANQSNDRAPMKQQQAELFQSLGATRAERGDARGAIDAYVQSLELYRSLAEKPRGDQTATTSGAPSK